MIQFTLLFLLGFLSAVFLIILVSPVVWRRAHYLWRRQMAAKLPVNLTAIEADRDLLRSIHAAEQAKTQMLNVQLQHKYSRALIQIGTDRQTLEKFELTKQELEQLHHTHKQSLNIITDYQSQLELMNTNHSEQTDKISQLHRQNDALSHLSDILRIEIVSRETEIDRLQREAKIMRDERKQLKNGQAELGSQIMALKTSLESEQMRNQALEEKLQRLLTALSDAQEKLERYETSQQTDNNKLRTEITELAAEMVALTAAQEGDQSPIHGLLQRPEPDVKSFKSTSTKSGSNQPSLAKRIVNIPH